MSLAPSSVVVDVVGEPRAVGWLGRLEQALGWLGERVNPILVKETRQAMKSRQFVVTFTLVLLCAWLWSMLGLSAMGTGPEIAYGSYGPQMFMGYYLILGFALTVIVPFGAYRSLAVEVEDGTYEMLTISTLRPRQIVSGKLGSAIAQMLVYFSAVAPCMAFTYLLRGIDFPSILLWMGLVFFWSLGLSLIGLLLATVTQERHWQMFVTVLYVVALVGAFWLGCAMSIGMVFQFSGSLRDPEFWLALSIIASVYASYFALFFLVASAQLTFASENRSTSIRVCLLAQQALFTGWIAYGTFESGVGSGGMMAWFTVSALHWYLTGVFLTSESPELSPRVRRGLPQSLLGRLLFTWFNPGPGSGFLFAVANLSTVVLLSLAVVLFSETTRALGTRSLDDAVYYIVIGFGYFVAYVGVGRLIMGGVRRFAQITPLLPVLLQILLLLAGTGVPMTIHLMSPTMRNDYALIEITNPFWTMLELGNGRGLVGGEREILIVFVPLFAAVVFLLNLPAVLAEVRFVRMAKPRRVAQEDQQLEAERTPVVPVQTSPWDAPAEQKS